MCGLGVDNYESIQRNRLKVKKCVHITNYGYKELLDEVFFFYLE